MTTHFLVKHSFLLKLLEFIQTRSLGTSTPLQDETLNQEKLSSTQHTQAFRQLQQTYYLERRFLL
jgi:hypothetical protein